MANEPHLRVLTQGVERGHAVLADAVATYTRVLGERLLAAYALGSLAYGGFSPLASDEGVPQNTESRACRGEPFALRPQATAFTLAESILLSGSVRMSARSTSLTSGLKPP